jgi:hypothetical protein
VRARRRSPQDWRLVPLVAGIVGVWWSEKVQSDPGYVDSTLLRWVSNLSPLSILVGLALAGPLVCFWIGRVLARSSRRPTTLIAARRIAADPYTTSYAVSGVALAMFVATTLGLIAAAERPIGDDRRASLDRGVVAVHALVLQKLRSLPSCPATRWSRDRAQDSWSPCGARTWPGSAM